MLNLHDVFEELELAANELGDDMLLSGELLDLATIAVALAQPELWLEISDES